MTTYSFTLRFSGVTYEGSEGFAEALFSPDVDCSVSFRGGLAGVHFGWEATDLRTAVLAAIEYAKRADPAARVVALEVDGGHTIDEALAA